MIEAKGQTGQYVGFPFVWFGHEITSKELATMRLKKCKSASRYLTENRYGSVVFTIELKDILPHVRRFYSLGTRKFRKEYSHSILVTEDKREASYSIINGSEMQTLEDHADEGDSWPSTLPLRYSSSGEWSHPEWAFAFNVSLKKALKGRSVKIEFVDHDPETCVKNLDPNLKCLDCRFDRKTRAKSLKDFDDLVQNENLSFSAWLKANAFSDNDKKSMKWTSTSSSQ
jgi:hypothetical protein